MPFSREELEVMRREGLPGLGRLAASDAGEHRWRPRIRVCAAIVDVLVIFTMIVQLVCGDDAPTRIVAVCLGVVALLRSPLWSSTKPAPGSGESQLLN